MALRCATRRYLTTRAGAGAGACGVGGNDTASATAVIHTLPKRIILMRHGESLGNADENLYAEIPDWKIPLTRRGERQTERAARDLHALVKGESLLCYCSPYKRTKESWGILRKYLEDQGDVNLIGVREEPRIAEQQFGNFQSKYQGKREAEIEGAREGVCVCV